MAGNVLRQELIEAALLGFGKVVRFPQFFYEREL